ncbi:MAG: phosphoadenosine phosphosulfate reductase family protein [Candidatus Poribacteria bacterium]|nr:phosphoadenosine phosphosulfate reductase family protein [Candidatus Poribacteria bacterium]
MLKLDIKEQNRFLRHKTPEEIIEWALPLTRKRIVTTSFGVYSAVLLSTFSKKDPDINVIWCDTGYNNYETYEHAQKLIRDYNLNINIYVPRRTKAFIDLTLGLPTVDDPKHESFTELVKLEPFRRALAEHKPEVWFTNIRVRQTAYRDLLDILSYSKEGILKISPFYYWKDEDLDAHVRANGLLKNTAYFDPVKALQSRECGIHLTG